MPDWKAPSVGDVFTNPCLASVFEELASGGAEAFYEGADSFHE
jgi:gamma-glutamyltranspeptidase / glutathione hydrolase